MKKKAETWFRQLRKKLITSIEAHDTVKFKKKKWKHSGHGGGLMSIIEGETIERGGVNISTVSASSIFNCVCILLLDKLFLP